MKTLKTGLFVAIAAIFLSTGPQVVAQNNPNSNGSEKITICHYPPGNPDNPQTITVSVNALEAHLAHGDEIGPCANEESNGLLIIKAGPNPCVGKLNINYFLKEKGQVRMDVYKFDGSHVNMLMNIEQEPGLYEEEFDAEVSGISGGLIILKAEVQTEAEFVEESVKILMISE